MPRSLKEVIGEMRQPLPDRDYFALTVVADENERISWSSQTHFEGFADDSARFELRAASLVNPDWMIDAWKTLGEPYVVVSTDLHLRVFLGFIGGNALVEQSIAQRWLSDIIAPEAVARSGFFGFKSVASLPSEALNRAPTRKQRMRVLQRDGYRCKVCGRRPADYVDVELHVHHVRMWSKGGLTEDENLITLCGTCHDGLDPHEDLTLFGLIDPSKPLFDPSGSRRRLLEGIKWYRQLARRVDASTKARRSKNADGGETAE